jgi:hypothetical protein
MSTNHHPVHIPFPLWPYLTQPLFSSTQVILNPFQFQYYYHSQLLERCWICDSVQLLERCWAKSMELSSSSN